MSFTLFFFLVAFLLFYVAMKGFKANNRYGGSSTCICGILFVFFGYFSIYVEFFPFPFTGFMIWWIWMTLVSFIAFGLIIKRIIKKMEFDNQNPNNSKSKLGRKSFLRKYVELMTKENPYKDNNSIKKEGIRKSFHLAGLLFVYGYFGFFFLLPLTEIVNNTVVGFIKDTEMLYNVFWGDIKDYPYEKGDFQAIIDLTAFALIGSLIFAIISDIVRILWGPEYSVFNFLTRAALRNKEYNAFGAHIYLITGILFTYMLYLMGLVHILTVTAGVLISCFSDAMAALIGRKCGKHKIKCIGGDTKSMEGFIAGTGSAFIIGLVILGPIYALVAAIIFFLLDYFPIAIADNITNPILIPICITIAFALLGLPIGWV